MIKYVCLALSFASQAAQAHKYISKLLFLLVRERSRKKDMSLAYTILITIEFDYVKSDSRLAAYEGVVLQRFKFIKICMGTQRFTGKVKFYLYFVNKIYLPCCCVVFLVFCQLLRAI